MIHELLFNLWNNPCNVVDTEDFDWTHLFDLPQFLHPGEQKLLEVIVSIGVDYHRITLFTNQILNESLTRKDKADLPNIHSGFYLRAFCNGIQEVLSDYRKEILKLEEMFLKYPQLSLTHILSAIDKYRDLFGVLKSMIENIKVENIHGCLLLSALHKYVNFGVDEIEEAANVIIRFINTLFYQHLCNWIVYGDLVDPCNEFFICDGKVSDETFLYPDQQSENNPLSTAKKTTINRPPPVRKFYINWDLIPSFISEDLAESILFMGRIVWIVRNEPKKQANFSYYQTKSIRDVWEGQEFSYYNKIQSLGNQSFNLVEFRKVVEECRLKLTKYLWSLMLNESNLIHHLTLIREYYALGRGELFQQFFAMWDTCVHDVPTQSIVQHINLIFYQTAHKIYGENEKSYLKFEFTSSSVDISKINPWLGLELNFELEWPLHIIFHPEVMEFYNRLFRFLLRLKKTQVNLFKLWSNHTLSKQKIDKRVWTLRQKLMFLVNNLQYYMQVNVIEAEFSTFLKSLENVSELEDIIKIHHEFVTNLLGKSFVLTPDNSQGEESRRGLCQIPALQNNVPSKVYNVITKLLELCDEFCLVASIWDAELTKPDLDDLEILQKRSDIATESLLFVLYSLHEKVRGGHLLQLLLHLDFNRHFSKTRDNAALSTD